MKEWAGNGIIFLASLFRGLFFFFFFDLFVSCALLLRNWSASLSIFWLKGHTKAAQKLHSHTKERSGRQCLPVYPMSNSIPFLSPPLFGRLSVFAALALGRRQPHSSHQIELTTDDTQCNGYKCGRYKCAANDIDIRAKRLTSGEKSCSIKAAKSPSVNGDDIRG